MEEIGVFHHLVSLQIVKRIFCQEKGGLNPPNSAPEIVQKNKVK